MPRTSIDEYRDKMRKIKKRIWQKHHGETKKMRFFLEKPPEKKKKQTYSDYKKGLKVKNA